MELGQNKDANNSWGKEKQTWLSKAVYEDLPPLFPVFKHFDINEDN